MRSLFSVTLLAGLLLSFAAQAEPLRVVASFSILGDMVHQVGGDQITLDTLVPPNTDTHTYQPTPEDAKKLAAADFVFVNGLGFEGWIDRLIKASGFKGKLVVVSNGLVARMTDKETDPHAWQSLPKGRLYVKNITTALAAAFPPEEAEMIRQRSRDYDTAIARMDAYVKKEIAAVPVSRRKIITSHDAFGYFGAVYGVTFVAPMGMNTEAEPSAQTVAKLITQIKKEKVKQLFIENMTNPKLIEQIAADTGATMGGALYSDALSEPSGPASTYLDMFRNNVPKMKAAMMLNGD